jgi:hypothetical protein
MSFFNRFPMLLDSGDKLLVQLGIILAVSPAGEMYSIDSWLKKRSAEGYLQSKTCAPWAQRLMQVLITMIYCKVFWIKCCGTPWWDGTAVYYAVHMDAFRGLPVPYVFDHLWTAKLLTWGTLLIEFSLWTLIWIKEFRYWVLLVGVVFHLGIDWAMYIPLFEYTIIFAYVSFLEPADVEQVIDKIKKFFQESKSTLLAQQTDS